MYDGGMIIKNDIQELNGKMFCQKIEELATINRSYIKSVIEICDHFGVSPEFGARLLSKPIVEKIHQEGESANLLPKISKLPI